MSVATLAAGFQDFGGISIQKKKAGTRKQKSRYKRLFVINVLLETTAFSQTQKSATVVVATVAHAPSCHYCFGSSG
jgi:hypothetical protein